MSSEPPEGVAPPATDAGGDGSRAALTAPRPGGTDAPPSSSSARRRSRRTVKIPNDAVPESAPAEPATVQMTSTLVGVPGVTDTVTPKPPAVDDSAPPKPEKVEPPLQAIPQAPPIPRPGPAVPRPTPKAAPAAAPAATDAAASAAPTNGAASAEPSAAAKPPPAPPPQEDAADVIRPMRIISIGGSAAAPPPPAPAAASAPTSAPPTVPDKVSTAAPSPPPAPAAAPAAPPAAATGGDVGRASQPSLDSAWDEPAEPHVSRPPMHAAHDGDSAPAPAPPEAAAPPPVPRPSKPSAIEEIDVVEEVAAPAVPKPPKPPPAVKPKPREVVEEVEAVEAVEEVEAAADAAPRGAKTDEIEPIEIEDHVSATELPVDGEVPVDADVPVDVEEDAVKPKKPPPPPPAKRPSSGEMGAVAQAAPRVEGASPPPPPPAGAAPPPPPAAAAAAAAPPPPPAAAAPAAPAAAAPLPPPAAAAAAPAAGPPGPPPPPPPAITTAPSSAGPPATPTIDLTGKKRQKPWWEEIFSDDYIRTLERVEPKVIRKECDFIEDRLGLEKGAVMLDLACGEGAHAVELAGRGYKVVGFDLSLAMLARAQDEAQDKGQKINFLQGDMREMVFEGAFDGIYSWSTSFGYFDDEKNLNVLSRVHRSLRQGGMFLLDVINRDYVCPRQPSLVWFEGDGCVCMDEMHVDFFTSRLRVKRTVMFEDGRARECDYSIRLYGLHELGRMLHETGFKVVEVTGHPAHPGVFFGSESPRIIVLAERG